MRTIVLLLLSSALVSSSLMALPSEEILILEQLVATTKKNLENQQVLLKLVRSYLNVREAYLTDPDNGKLATSLVKRAVTLQQLLEKEHLSHLFDSDFLSEVAFYHRVGKQHTVHD